jgi:hypothetical protein
MVARASGIELQTLLDLPATPDILMVTCVDEECPAGVNYGDWYRVRAARRALVAAT